MRGESFGRGGHLRDLHGRSRRRGACDARGPARPTRGRWGDGVDALRFDHRPFAEGKPRRADPERTRHRCNHLRVWQAPTRHPVRRRRRRDAHAAGELSLVEPRVLERCGQILREKRQFTRFFGRGRRHGYQR